MSWFAVAVGGALGASGRWGLSLWFSALPVKLSVATAIANLLGAYLIGIAVAFFSAHPHISPEWRLFAVTGFLGGLTTFSTFSAESMSLLQRGDFGWALGHTLLHVIGSIVLCFAGYATYKHIAG